MHGMLRLTFTLTRLGSRACALLALGLMAFATLAPMVTSALVPAPAHGIEVCTDRKSKRMRPSMARDWGFKTRLTEAV